MPLNKSFQRRIEVLDSCLLRRQRVWTIDSLLQEVNEKLEGMGAGRIAKRTLYDDLRYLNQDLDAPIEKYKHGNQTCYRYPDYYDGIRKLPLKQEEVGYLRDALEILRQVKGFQLTSELETVIGKLENTLATSVEKRHTIVQFEQETLTTGSQWLDDIFEAVKDQTVLLIRYKPFTSEKVDALTIHPYLLKEYRNRWFVIGRKDGMNTLTILALDRIQKINGLTKPFQHNDLFDPDTYYHSVVGVSLPKDVQPEKIQFQVKKELAPYVLTKPVHPSQKLVKSAANGDITLELFVVNNYELRSQLLGLGPKLKVIAPVCLRDQMKELYELGVQSYAKGQKQINA